MISNINLRLNYLKDIENKGILEEIKRLGSKSVKINTIKLNLDYDRKDQTKIRSIKNMNIIYELEGNEIISLKGNMQCTFANGFKGEFFVKNIRIDKETNFEKIKGVDVSIDFSNELYPISNNDLYPILQEIVKDENFVIDISQFDEFMENFNYYKELTSEYNNNASFDIKDWTNNYYFLPVSSLIENNNYVEIYNKNNILIGYKLEKSQFESLSNDTKELVKVVFNIIIDKDKKVIKRWDTNNVYVSDIKKINDKNVKQLKKINVLDSKELDDKIELVCEVNQDLSNHKYKYLNYYDMGQQIKIESINESLRLINNSARSDSFYMIDYLIGDKEIPTYKSELKNTEEYTKNLNEWQKDAFLMAVDGSPISLIKGPPGTGKTHVINAIIQYITKELNEKLLFHHKHILQLTMC